MTMTIEQLAERLGQDAANEIERLTKLAHPLLSQCETCGKVILVQQQWPHADPEAPADSSLENNPKA